MGKITIGVAGATGYGGQELLRLAARHDGIAIKVAMSSADSSNQEIPSLNRLWNGTIEPFSLDRLIKESEVVFLGLPEAASAELAPKLLESGKRVFDLSGAFRLRDDDARNQWYPSSPTIPDGTAYGLTEWNRHEISAARFVACPGCYPTAAILALKPLLSAGLISENSEIYVDAKSGISGAGKRPTERTHFSEVHGNIAAYGIFSHRHGAEIEQELRTSVTFVPHLVPLNRGIFETIYTRLQSGTTNTDVTRVFEAAYKDAPFVRLTFDRTPEIQHVAYTNFCDIGWRIEGNRIILVSCIDNLLKGAAGQALQNFNVASGFDERKGLL